MKTDEDEDVDANESRWRNATVFINMARMEIL